MGTWRFPNEMASWIDRMARMLDGRNAWRVCPLLVGALFATGRRTVASWLRAGGLSKDYKDFYYFLYSLGWKVQPVASRLLDIARVRLAPTGRLLFALDDTVTKRYGPHVEGAGIHRNPTPGPADQTFAYGHVWVTIAWIVRHPWWGTIGLPLLAKLYVRAKDIWLLSALYGWKFQTKLEQAAELLEWAVSCVRWLKLPIWAVVDGGFVKRPFLRRALAAGVVVVGRLRKDAALWSVPKPCSKRGRGRPRKYGPDRISLAKRAGARGGWQTDEFEQDFHDIKEVHGSGQQQLRNVWANIGAFNLILWLHTLLELWAWNLPHEQLCDRRQSPWDDPTRRPSHADRCKALRRACFVHDFSTLPIIGPGARKIHTLFKRLVALVM